MKFVLVFVILFMTIAINLPTSVIARLGFEADYLIAALLAVVITGLIQHKKLFLVVIVMFCSIVANMPKEALVNWSMNPDYFFAILVGLILTPIGAKMSGRF